MKNKLVFTHNPWFKKAAWTVGYRNVYGVRSVDVYRTKKIAVAVAKKLRTADGIVDIDWIGWEDRNKSLAGLLGRSVRITDMRSRR